MNVLYWIHNKSAVQTRTEPSEWRYVSTNFKPADKVTRGIKGNDIANSNTWESGLEVLGITEDEWPSKKKINRNM